MLNKNEIFRRRADRVRYKIRSVSKLYRLSVFRSHKHIYAQIIDDAVGATLVSASSLDKDYKALMSKGSDIGAAKVVGKMIAERAVKNGIPKVVFDRGGYRYHGRVKAVADAAREAGLEF